jgi:hypothetical protein
MSTDADRFNERLRQYIAEQTGLSLATVEAVLDAQMRFYTEHTGNVERARDLLKDE